MQRAKLPKNEKARVNKLAATGVLNADRHKQFTIFNEVAKVITNCTSSFVNIIDQDTQHSLSSSGLETIFQNRCHGKNQYANLHCLIPNLLLSQT